MRLISLAKRAALVLLASTTWSAAHAADGVDGSLVEERTKQDRIYRGDAEQVRRGYTIDRGLVDYTKGLPSDFSRALAALGPEDRWMDVGAGEGKAILDYFSRSYDQSLPQGLARPGRKAQAVAMSIEDRRTQDWHQTAATLGTNQIRYMVDKRLREYSTDELGGRFNVITDVIGGFSYSENLSLFIEKVMGFLQVNGTFYSVLQDVQWENGANKPHYEGAPFLTTIADADGSDMKICTWLKRIRCAEVTCEPRAEWQPTIEAFRIRKTCEDVQVPALSLVRYQAGTPPERRYELRPQASQSAQR